MTHDDRPRAVLWDLDGTMLDSAEQHFDAWCESLADEGHDLTRAEFEETFGWRNDAILRHIFGDDFPDDEVQRVGVAKEAQYRALMRERGAELLPGVARLLDGLQRAGWRQAVASSAPQKNIETVLDVLGIGDYFAAQVSAEDVEHGKPDPEVFLLAARQLNVPPERCIVVEDAPAGLEAARRGGMHSIGVRTTHDDLEADVVVDTLEQLSTDAFARLVNTRRDPYGIRVGDPVVVKPGTGDPDLEIDVSGWQGRITEIVEEGDETFVSMQWDSVTLRNAPDGMFVECEENGMDWSEMYLLVDDVEPTEPRDSEEDVARTIERLEKKYAWTYLGEQGDRIRAALGDVDPEDHRAMLDAWRRYFEKRLQFPFTAVVFELQPPESPYRRGDRVRVMRLADIDEEHGILVETVREHERYDVPLKDLAATDEQSRTHQLLDDYSVWFANRDRYTVRS